MRSSRAAPFEPLEVAAQPEEVVGDPAGQVAGTAPDQQGRPAQHGRADDVPLLLAGYPDVLAQCVQREPAAVEIAPGQHPGETAGQGAPPLAVEQEEQSQQDRPRLQPVRGQAGRERRYQWRGGDEVARGGGDALARSAGAPGWHGGKIAGTVPSSAGRIRHSWSAGMTRA